MPNAYRRVYEPNANIIALVIIPFCRGTRYLI